MYGGGVATKGDAERRKQEAEAFSRPIELDTKEEKISNVHFCT